MAEFGVHVMSLWRVVIASIDLPAEMTTETLRRHPMGGWSPSRSSGKWSRRNHDG